MPPELGSKHLSPGKQCGRGFSLGSQRQGHWADETRSNSEEPQRADGKGGSWAGEEQEDERVGQGSISGQ